MSGDIPRQYLPQTLLKPQDTRSKLSFVLWWCLGGGSARRPWVQRITKLVCRVAAQDAARSNAASPVRALQQNLAAARSQQGHAAHLCHCAGTGRDVTSPGQRDAEKCLLMLLCSSPSRCLSAVSHLVVG